MRTNADILLLDEPTSEMDTEAELAVFSNLRTIGQDKMVIIISHRFCHMRTADQIIVLDDGEILEHGSHDELIKFGGLYARLFVLQVESYKGIK
jgi:ABC-type multidrug transport system fused ATPase/permease subunit